MVYVGSPYLTPPPSLCVQESEEGFPLGSGSTLSKVYELKPLLSNNKDKWGLGKNLPLSLWDGAEHLNSREDEWMNEWIVL